MIKRDVLDVLNDLGIEYVRGRYDILEARLVDARITIYRKTMTSEIWFAWERDSRKDIATFRDVFDLQEWLINELENHKA